MPPGLSALLDRLSRQPYALAVMFGVLTSFAFAPASWWPLAVVAVTGLFALWQGRTPRNAFQIGFWFGAGLFGAGTWWLFTAIHTFGQAPAWLAIVLMLGLVAIMATYYGALGWVAARFLPRAGALRWLAALPAGWVLLEWLRSWVLTGFPWLEIGYAGTGTWLAGLAPIGGVHLLSFAIALTAGAIVTLVLGSSRERIAAAAMIVLAWGSAWAIDRIDWTRPAGDPLRVALVQGAIPQDLKWQESNREATLRLYRGLTEQAYGTPLIVWPEAALPVLAHEARDYISELWTSARARNSDLILGVLRYDFDQEKFYNAVVALGDEATWYYKRRLVPFGEFFPVPKFVRRWMRLMSLPYVDMSAGDEAQSPLLAAGQRIGATICYEDAYGSAQLAVLREATLLVNATNNAWFGDSAAPHQQLEMARLRAREAGRYLVRATSNGVTAIIAPDGRVTAVAPQFEPHVLYGEVTPRTGLTPYARVGNSGIVLFSLALVAVGIVQRRRAGR